MYHVRGTDNSSHEREIYGKFKRQEDDWRRTLESRVGARTSLDRRNPSSRLALVAAFKDLGGGFHEPLCDFVAIMEHLLQFRVQETCTQKFPNHAQGGPVIDLVAKDGAPLAIVQKQVAMIPVRKRA